MVSTTTNSAAQRRQTHLGGFEEDSEDDNSRAADPADEYRIEEQDVEARALEDMRARFWRARSAYDASLRGTHRRQKFLLSLVKQEEATFESCWKKTKRYYKDMGFPFAIPGLEVPPEDLEEDVREPTEPNTDGLSLFQASYARWRTALRAVEYWLSQHPDAFGEEAELADFRNEANTQLKALDEALDAHRRLHLNHQVLGTYSDNCVSVIGLVSDVLFCMAYRMAQLWRLCVFVSYAIGVITAIAGVIIAVFAAKEDKYSTKALGIVAASVIGLWSILRCTKARLQRR